MAFECEIEIVRDPMPPRYVLPAGRYQGNGQRVKQGYSRIQNRWGARGKRSYPYYIWVLVNKYFSREQAEKFQQTMTRIRQVRNKQFVSVCCPLFSISGKKSGMLCNRPVPLRASPWAVARRKGRVFPKSLSNVRLRTCM